jgi:hypothetical protein
VDDILNIYNEKATNIDNMLSEFNNVSPKLKFASQLEENGNNNFLDINITESQNSIETAIYRKLTTADCIICHDYCHPTQQKISGIRYLVNRMLDYQIPNNKKTEDGKVIQTILHNNHYHCNTKNTIQQKTKKQCQKTTNDVHSHKEKKKLATVTNVGRKSTTLQNS